MPRVDWKKSTMKAYLSCKEIFNWNVSPEAHGLVKILHLMREDPGCLKKLYYLKDITTEYKIRL